jgi:hypothetical protein
MRSMLNAWIQMIVAWSEHSGDLHDARHSLPDVWHDDSKVSVLRRHPDDASRGSGIQA